jgi:hypothetical protein
MEFGLNDLVFKSLVRSLPVVENFRLRKSVAQRALTKEDHPIYAQLVGSKVSCGLTEVEFQQSSQTLAGLDLAR